MARNNFDVLNLVRDNVKRLKPYASARDEYNEMGDGMVFLDANENPFETSVNRYPDPQQIHLKQKLSRLKGIPVNQILLGNGSDEVLDLVFRAFCEPKQDSVITLPPTYGMYSVLANINDVGNISIKLTDTFQPNVAEILNAATANTKILFLCTPNNPTSNSFEAESVEKLIKNFNGLVVIDEAYIDFSNQQSCTTRLQDFPNLIVTQTMSKAYGMAGVRLGVCFASAQIIAIMNRIKPPYNVNELTQRRAMERLENPKMVVEEVHSILNQRAWLHQKLKEIPFIEHVFPSDANFILVKVDNANLRHKQLIDKGIVVRNRTREPLCENCLRFTVGTIEENRKLLSNLKTL